MESARTPRLVSSSGTQHLVDIHLSTDEESFFDIWTNGTGVSLHLGKYRLDLCRPQRLTVDPRLTSGRPPNPRGCRDSPRP